MRLRKGWCRWAEKPCPASCPVPSVDNFGNHYPGCALVRLKTQAEIDAMCAPKTPDAKPEGTVPDAGTGSPVDQVYQLPDAFKLLNRAQLDERAAPAPDAKPEARR